ncbi:MAG: hypothetical protein L3K02_05210 [Thermoplasmata archaeon]|nr:hypothetical protein [Thermoplasmata archaeon]
MSTPRPVRIPRTPAAPRGPSGTGARVDHRPNEAGTQRAFRFAILYLLALVVLDVILVVLDLSSQEAGRPGVESGLQLFIGIAVVLAVGSVVFALSPAPRSVELRTDGVMVVGRWGQRTLFPPIAQLDAKVLRHYPGGILSAHAVDLVQVVDRAGRRRTYQVESGLFDAPTDPAV